MECALLNDKRRIVAMQGDYAGDKRSATVGQDGVTSISVIRVAGQGGWVPWFEVAHDGTISRWNGERISAIEYAKDEPPANEPVGLPRE